MFDFELGEDLSLIVETARDFARDHLTPRLREHESERVLGDGVRAAFREIGLAGLELSEAQGGAGLGASERVLVNEELAAADVGAAVALDPLGTALYALREAGGEDALKRFALPLLEAGGARAVLVCEADAELEVGERVSGSIPWVPADRVDLLVLQSGDETLVIEEGMELVSLRGSGLRAAGASEVRLRDADVAARWRDGEAVERTLARARLYTASLLLGVLRHAAEFSREYAKEREAFGRPIAHHQGLAFLIVDMRSAVDGARLLLHEAAWRADRGLSFAAESASAFVEATEASLLVGPNGVQILGGHGFMQDYPVEKAMREARLLGLTLGGADAARIAAAEPLCRRVGQVPLSYEAAAGAPDGGAEVA